MRINKTVIFLFLIGVFIIPRLYLNAETVEELRTKISGNRAEVQKIEAEIAKYEEELKHVQGSKRSLQNTLRELDLSRRKLNSEIKLTRNKIHNIENHVQTLSERIDEYNKIIATSKKGIGQSLRVMNELDDTNMVELILSKNNVADAWIEADSLTRFQGGIQGKIHAVSKAKEELLTAKQQKEEEKRRLAAENDTLTSHKTSLDITRRAKDRLLKQTKNKESAYQKLLAEKRKAKESFERAMAEYEAKLKYILDKTKIPKKGSAIFMWPVRSHHITQYFGNTKFARSGAYNGRGHNGIDIRAAIGDRVNAVLSGVVQDTNEKVARNCQYGKWVLIKHNNGLTTLYAHLSAISVHKGESVVTGQRIGYAGDTGYAFGPHLHLTTYASGAVRFKQYKCRSNGQVVKVPISAYSGYLNPLDYL